MTADTYQVGGTHYIAKYQHWDFVLDCNLPYLEGNATRYLTRLGKKDNTRLDIEKALHYTAKLEGRVAAGFYPTLRPPRRWVVDCVKRFVAANNLSGEVHAITRYLATWDTVHDIQVARRLTLKLLEAFDADRAQKSIPDAKPVPLEDSNKYAPRAGASE